MNAWTQWVGKTVMLTAGLGAAVVGLSPAAFASTGPATSGTGSVAGGNQVSIPITVPVNVCGNAAALLGVATAGCQGGATALLPDTAGPAMRTNGTGSVAGGNQVSAPVVAPVDVCGNAIGNAAAHCAGGAAVRGHRAGSPSTSGTGSVLGGNQVRVPVTAPVNVCGNSVAVLGVAGSVCQGGAAVGHTPGRTLNRVPAPCSCATGSAAVTSLLPVVEKAAE